MRATRIKDKERDEVGTNWAQRLANGPFWMPWELISWNVISQHKMRRVTFGTYLVQQA